ncbi:MAG: threonylcarbamoyl-AMP synthase [Candidatus Aenigmarchaeota archaeon]|nr:threonylcarbamoyl-AMP synthase [Candidatus Aenigmarchaeota archaeon]
MKIIKLKDFRNAKKSLSDAIKSGKIFVYPTDTLYGIGCNAKIRKSVEKIIKAKNRDPEKPLSIIAPSKEWIFENTIITEANKKLVDSLFPGPYTVVLKTKLKIPYIVSKNGKIGIRVPKNEFCDFIRGQGVLFVTTSVNISDEPPATKIGDIPNEIKKIADYAIDAGKISGEASRVFDLSGKDVLIVRF